MKEHFSRPRSFGQILDQTFRISKNHFSTFFLITLIVVSPVILIEALIAMLTGTELIRDVAGGETVWEQLYNTINESAYTPTSLAQDFGVLLVGFISVIFYPIAQAAILYGIDAIRKEEHFTASTLIKKAFARFWPIFGSALLFRVIIFALIFIPVLVISVFMLASLMMNPMMGIFPVIILFLAVGCVIAFLLTRWGLYLPAVVFERVAPGLERSWNLTRGNFWRTFGLFVVIGAITIIISVILDFVLISIFGYSVLYSVLLSISTIITRMFFSVGYGLIYFDLKLRNDGDDLMEMIENYDSINS